MRTCERFLVGILLCCFVAVSNSLELEIRNEAELQIALTDPLVATAASEVTIIVNTDIRITEAFVIDTVFTNLHIISTNNEGRFIATKKRINDSPLFTVTGSMKVSGLRFEGFGVETAADAELTPKRGVFWLKLSSTASLIVTDCFFINNAAIKGGAIHNELGTLQVYNSSFVNNQAEAGGAIYTIRPESTNLIADCIFINNKASKNGGAVHSWYSSVLITRSFFNGNIVSGPLGKNGGAFFSTNSVVEFSDSKFFSNQASEDGGAIYVANSLKLILQSGSFSDNKAVQGNDVMVESREFLGMSDVLYNFTISDLSLDVGSNAVNSNSIVIVGDNYSPQSGISCVTLSDQLTEASESISKESAFTMIPCTSSPSKSPSPSSGIPSTASPSTASLTVTQSPSVASDFNGGSRNEGLDDGVNGGSSMVIVMATVVVGVVLCCFLCFRRCRNRRGGSESTKELYRQKSNSNYNSPSCSPSSLPLAGDSVVIDMKQIDEMQKFINNEYSNSVAFVNSTMESKLGIQVGDLITIKSSQQKCKVTCHVAADTFQVRDIFTMHERQVKQTEIQLTDFNVFISNLDASSFLLTLLLKEGVVSCCSQNSDSQENNVRHICHSNTVIINLTMDFFQSPMNRLIVDTAIHLNKKIILIYDSDNFKIYRHLIDEATADFIFYRTHLKKLQPGFPYSSKLPKSHTLLLIKILKNQILSENNSQEPELRTSRSSKSSRPSSKPTVAII